MIEQPKISIITISYNSVKTIEDMLNTNIVALTAKAQEFGITMGMPVKEALEKFAI